ncbi:MAG: glycine zipper 2TM domain-containing protein [Aquabacterium sp.]|nr:glycine zipper 2TM domain-containing protein [Aquabacterium sp.]
MTIRQITLVCSVSALALVTACASNPPRSVPYQPANTQAPYQAVQYGNVSRIDVVSASSRTSGGCAVLGAVLGAVVGRQIGSGSGRDVATGLGAIGGAVIGNTVEARRKGDAEVYRISVQLDNGSEVQFDYQRIDDLRVGDRVRLQDGQLHRV